MFTRFTCQAKSLQQIRLHLNKFSVNLNRIQTSSYRDLLTRVYMQKLCTQKLCKMQHQSTCTNLYKNTQFLYIKKNNKNKAEIVVGNFLIEILGSKTPLSLGPFHVECLLCSGNWGGTKAHLAKLSVEIFSFAKYKSLTYFVLFLIVRQLFQYSLLIIYIVFPIILA